MSLDYEKSLLDYIDAIKRHKLYIIIGFPILAILCVIVIMQLPPVYQSQGKILIESQEVPSDLIKSTVTTYAEQQIEEIKQRIMTTAKVTSIVDKYNVYPQLKGKVSDSQIADTFRQAADIKMISANVLDPKVGYSRRANIAFSVSFDHKNPVSAQKVANEIVTLFLNENAKNRVSKAGETYAFLKEEANKMRSQVQILEDKMASYRAEYGDRMQNLMQFNLSMIKDLQEQLNTVHQEESKLRDQSSILSMRLSTVSKNLSTNSGISPDQNIANLKEELASLLNRYSDQHPDVKQLKREIQQAESNRSNSNMPKSALNPEYMSIQAQLESIKNTIDNYENQKIEITKQIDSYQNKVNETPQVQRGFEDLARDYQSTLDKYNELRSKELGAQIAQNLETENKAGSFTLIEPPLVPIKPIKPNRIKLILMAAVASLGFCIALTILRETLDPKVRGVGEISALVNENLLAIIPNLVTPKVINYKKMVLILVVGLLLLSVLSLIIINLYVIKIDILWFKIVDKISF